MAICSLPPVLKGVPWYEVVIWHNRSVDLTRNLCIAMADDKKGSEKVDILV